MASLRARITREEVRRSPPSPLTLALCIISLACCASPGMQTPNSSDVEISSSRSAPYRLELIDTGIRQTNGSTIDSVDTFFVRLVSLESASSRREEAFEFRLYRDPTLNRQLDEHTDYNVFVIDENGDDQRVDGLDLTGNGREGGGQQDVANSRVAFFRGHLVGRLLFSDGQDDILLTDSLVIAMGYLDGRSGFISLQAFIRKADGALLYLHPGTESTRTSAFNLHYLSSEENESFFEHFQRQFAVQQQQQQNQQLRRKRNAENKQEKRCPTMILADYSLFQLMNESRAKTVLFIHFVFTLANDIFESTAFTRSGFPPVESEGEEDEEGEFAYSGYGHSLCRIVIEEHLAERESDQLYNAGRPYWPQAELEAKLRKFKDRNQYGIAFLFTNLPISASADSHYADVNGFAMEGGIFSTDEELSNVGVVSFARCKDPWNLLCALTYPHELGHLWGAPHDIDTAECMPPVNGSYLVSFPFLDQIGPNNFKFSPCSIRWIYNKIEKLHSNPAGAKDFISYCDKCGNGQQEAGEECDELTFIEGSDVIHSLDDSDDEAVNGRQTGGCCTRSCKLRAGASCSPSNHHCCTDQCAIVAANSSTKCMAADLQYCFAEAHCDGTLDGCPAVWRRELRPKLPDGSPCLNGGTCQSGYCNSTCPAGSGDCECPAWAGNCRVCCQTVTKKEEEGVSRGECRPLAQVYRPEGTHCLFNETQMGLCTAEGWCRLRRDELSEGTVLPVTPRSLLPDDASDADFDRDDFWALIPVIGAIFVVVLLFGVVCLIRMLYRWQSTRTFELYRDETDGGGLNSSTDKLLAANGQQQQSKQKHDDNIAESCFCLPGGGSASRSVKIDAGSSGQQQQQQRTANGYSPSGNNV